MKDKSIYLDSHMIHRGTYYDSHHLPLQVGQSLYLYGDNSIKDIWAFIDVSEQLDGSSGVIITPTHLYFSFAKSGHFAYEDITKLTLSKQNRDSQQAVITLDTKTIRFSHRYFNVEVLLKYLSDMSDIPVDYSFSLHEGIVYYCTCLLNDISNDEYEDVVLDDIQKAHLIDLQDNLDVILQMNDEDYLSELEHFCPQVLSFVDELELDSEEIDELIALNQQLQEKESQYQEMLDSYLNNNKMKETMKSLGIDEKDLYNKSPEELNQYIDDLCEKFHVPRTMVDDMIKKFTR